MLTHPRKDLHALEWFLRYLFSTLVNKILIWNILENLMHHSFDFERQKFTLLKGKEI